MVCTAGHLLSILNGKAIRIPQQAGYTEARLHRKHDVWLFLLMSARTMIVQVMVKNKQKVYLGDIYEDT